MTHGSPEWVKERANAMSEEAQQELDDITNKAITRHGVHGIRLTQSDTVRIVCALTEVREQSFMLGLQIGLKTGKKLLEEKRK